MTILELCDVLESLMKEMSLESLSNLWLPAYAEAQSDEAHVEDHKVSLRLTREFHGTEGPQRMYSVRVSGTDSQLATTGTTPTSEARAKYIARLDPTTVSLLIAYIREKENECSK